MQLRSCQLTSTYALGDIHVGSHKDRHTAVIRTVIPVDGLFCTGLEHVPLFLSQSNFLSEITCCHIDGETEAPGR